LLWWDAPILVATALPNLKDLELFNWRGLDHAGWVKDGRIQTIWCSNRTAYKMNIAGLNGKLINLDYKINESGYSAGQLNW